MRDCRGDGIVVLHNEIDLDLGSVGGIHFFAPIGVVLTGTGRLVVCLLGLREMADLLAPATGTVGNDVGCGAGACRVLHLLVEVDGIGVRFAVILATLFDAVQQDVATGLVSLVAGTLGEENVEFAAEGLQAIVGVNAIELLDRVRKFLVVDVGELPGQPRDGAESVRVGSANPEPSRQRHRREFAGGPLRGAVPPQLGDRGSGSGCGGQDRRQPGLDIELGAQRIDQFGVPVGKSNFSQAGIEVEAGIQALAETVVLGGQPLVHRGVIMEIGHHCSPSSKCVAMVRRALRRLERTVAGLSWSSSPIWVGS
ncbi:hypothetical protein [Nocardia paucivorans]|uniref:hypothetical protein n=1 Tax=Nocardia paucivorans TaxID=114259 RepID=UPI0005926715|nr:hypothetical protein [Nocardia paucivorans]